MEWEGKRRMVRVGGNVLPLVKIGSKSSSSV